jgi:iron complex outermembrane recepter protein
MTSSLLRSAYIASALLAVQTSSTQAWAAAAAAAAAGSTGTSDSSDTSGGIQEVVVTAQRRTETLQEAAIPVSVLTGAELTNANVTEPTQLTNLVPALQVAPAAGPYNLFYLRGVGNFNANSLSDSAIAFNVDGVYIGRPSSTTGFFYDVDRLEVVKGPQGTLYGRNATGGAINVITTAPQLGVFGAAGSVDGGNYSSLRLDGSLNVPVGDTMAFRIAGIRVKHDGYMNDGTDDQDDYGGRASFRFDPSDTLNFNLVGDYFHQGGQGVGATPLLAPNGVATPSTFNVDQRIGFFSPQGQALYTSQPAGTLGTNFYPFPAGFQQNQDNHWWGVSGTMNWTSALGTLTVIPGYREGDLNYVSYVPGFAVDQQERSSQESAEVRFASNEKYPLHGILGYFYYKDETRDPTDSYTSNWNGQYDHDLAADTKSNAVFGRLTYDIKPELRINAGARQTWEDKDFSGDRISLTRVCFAPVCPGAPPLPYGTTPPALTGPGQVINPAFGPPPYGGFPDIINSPAVAQFASPFLNDDSRSFSNFTWHAGIDWDVAPQHLVYASVETGFKAGGFYFSPTTTDGSGSYDPETIRAYTLGSKNRFLDNRLQANLEVFYWRYSNQQLSHLITIEGVPTFATTNVGKADYKGAELEVEYLATPNTTLTADIQYLDATYKSFVYDTSNQNGGTWNGTGCPSVAVTADAYTVDCSGKTPPYAPEWSMVFGGQQKVPVAFGDFVLALDAHFQTSTYVGLEYLPIENQPSYWITDAQLSFQAPHDRYYVTAYVNNMFDETIKSQIYPTPGTAIYSTTLRPPRTYGLRIGFKF